MSKQEINIIRAATWDWSIPMYGNIHAVPYGTLKVVYKDENGEIKTVYPKTRNDKYTDIGCQYVIVNKQRYRVQNVGTLYAPQIKLHKINKVKGNDGKWRYDM